MDQALSPHVSFEDGAGGLTLAEAGNLRLLHDFPVCPVEVLVHVVVLELDKEYSLAVHYVFLSYLQGRLPDGVV